MTEQLMTAREVAGLLSISVETVLRLTRRGELPALRQPSGALRYSSRALAEWLAAAADAGRPGSVQPPDNLDRARRLHRSGAPDIVGAVQPSRRPLPVTTEKGK